MRLNGERVLAAQIIGPIDHRRGTAYWAWYGIRDGRVVEHVHMVHVSLRPPPAAIKPPAPPPPTLWQRIRRAWSLR